VNLPFTPDQFFGVFAEYNRAFVGVVVAFWAATVAVIVYAARDPARRSHLVSAFLGVLWLWNGLVYHAFLFTRINPAAWVFALLFVIQGLLFMRTATGRRVEYLSRSGWIGGVGMALFGYALAYPFLTMALGHPYPATPTFGVPCPTVILTIGLLLTIRGGVPLGLAVIPIIWSLIGGSAATLLDVPTDYALLAAGFVLMAVAIGRHHPATRQIGNT
jgi:hypothetical protein